MFNINITILNQFVQYKKSILLLLFVFEIKLPKIKN